MAIHLLKPALRAEDVYEFAQRQKQWHMAYAGGQAFPVWTSRRPARIDDMLAGGSIYWIVKRAIQCRQRIIGFEDYPAEDGEKPSYLIMCETDLVRTEALPKKPFQGWRYLDPSNAPKDIAEVSVPDKRPPRDMEKELREAGLL